MRPVEIAMDPVLLELEKAIPFALALNELLSAVILKESELSEQAPLKLSLRTQTRPDGATQAVLTIIDSIAQKESSCRDEHQTLSVSC